MHGSATKMGGKLKEGAGKARGDQKLQGEGVFDQINSRVQNAIGGSSKLARGEFLEPMACAAASSAKRP